MTQLRFFITACCLVPTATIQCATWNVDSLLALLGTAKEDTNKVMILARLGDRFHDADPDASLHYATQALLLAKKLQWTASYGKMEELVGYAEKELANYPAALEHLNKSIAYHLADGDSLRAAGIRWYISELYQEIGDSAHAISNSRQYLEFVSVHGNTSAIAEATRGLGYAYGSAGERAKAMSLYERAYDLAHAARDSSELALALEDIGKLSLEQGDEARAENCFVRSLAIARAENDLWKERFSWIDLSQLRRAQGRIREAVQCRYRALALNQALDDQVQMARDHHALGSLLRSCDSIRAALDHFRIALSLSGASGVLKLRTDVLESMMRSYQTVGRADSALVYMDRYLQSKDSLDRRERHAVVAGMTVRMELRGTEVADSLSHVNEVVRLENERTIEKLHGRNRAWGIGGGAGILLIGGSIVFISDRRRRKARFEKEAATLETQALRSQMNPHFIFNALNSISSFVQKNEPDRAVSFLARFARLMRLVLENSRQSEVPLKDDIEALDAYLHLERARSGEKFDYTITVDPSIDQEETMVPPLVVQPFVENAIWHGMAGKEGKGHISLSVSKHGDRLVMAIEDDGVGRNAPKAAVDPAIPKKSSLATVITRARLDLVEKQKGRPAGFTYIDLPQGTRVELSLPL